MDLRASQAVSSSAVFPKAASLRSPDQTPDQNSSSDTKTELRQRDDSLEQMRLAAAAGHIGTWEWDPASGLQSLSSELLQIFGLAAADQENPRIWAARVWPADWQKVQSLMQQGSETGEMEFEYRYLHPDHGVLWLYCKGKRFQETARMFGIIQDVTARKAAEEASQRLAAIVESADDAIISKDLTGTITSWNPAAERMFGFNAEEMIGRPITTIIPPELRDDENRILATIARGESIEHLETVRVKKNGDPIEVSLTVSPVKDESGRIVGAAKIARDITERKRTEQTLLMTERLAAVGRLAATVAHEINNPLEAVTNLVYLAKTANSLEQARHYLESAEEQLASVSHLTRQTLGFYRETSGGREIRPSEIIGPLLSVFSSRARNKGIQFSEEIEDDSAIFAVPGEIRQVVANLLSNSIDAVQGSGKVRVRVSAGRNWHKNDESGIRITVADTGSGIPPATRRRIFEPFYTTKRDVGTGLGLWVCKSVVDHHKGTIRVRSSAAPGKSWTAVSVYFPFDSRTKAGDRSDEESEPPLRMAS